MKTTCQLCFHHCALAEGQTGFCGARANHNEVIRSINYAELTALALDPIEKKPLRRFFPGSHILSVGSYGCNLHCSFCQNSGISQAFGSRPRIIKMLPEALIAKALTLKDQGNIGIAYTYNEPLISYEYVTDCSRLAHENGLKNVLVTNGTVEAEPLLELLPWVDAMNIDLKGFSQTFYDKVHGDLESVLRTITLSALRTHVEITTLVIPGENDSEAQIRESARWIAALNPDIPYHLTRFFPQFQMTDRNPTDTQQLFELAAAAREYLSHVYTGNC